MKKVILTSCFALALLSTWMAVPAFAQDVAAVAPTAPAARIATQIIEVVAYALGVVLMGLVGMLIKAVEKKFKVDVPDEYEVYVNKLLDKGIHYAEEQARKKVTPIAEKVSLGKLDAAAEFVLGVAERRKVKAMGKDKLKMLIEARLNIKRKDVA
jgi:hypothetical protein